jgi:hypothetical protein
MAWYIYTQWVEDKMQLLHIHIYTLGPLALTHSLCSHKLCTFLQEKEEEWPYLCRRVVTTKYGTQNRPSSIPCKTDQIFKDPQGLWQHHFLTCTTRADKCFCTFPPCESWDPFQHLIISYIYTSVACAVGPSVNPLQNRETQHVNIVLQCMYASIFWTAKYER